MSRSDAGFTLSEALVALGLMLIVATTVGRGLISMTQAQGTIWNRTEMHSSVRSATELLQQEVGQAGFISLPGPVTLTTPVVAQGMQTVTLSSVAGMFVGEQLTFDSGPTQETAAITAMSLANNQVTGVFMDVHAANAPVAVRGAFASGVVPTTTANGSTGTILKLFGDINGDGAMVYVEYRCTNGNLYRNAMPFDAGAKPAVTDSQVLLSNVLPNPGGTPCFTYQQRVAFGTTFVTDVAITLTVQTQLTDPVTKQFQRETKALLNVSPRNVVNSWEAASDGGSITSRVQPTPVSVTNLLP